MREVSQRTGEPTDQRNITGWSSKERATVTNLKRGQCGGQEGGCVFLSNDIELLRRKTVRDLSLTWVRRIG